MRGPRTCITRAFSVHKRSLTLPAATTGPTSRRASATVGANGTTTTPKESGWTEGRHGDRLHRPIPPEGSENLHSAATTPESLLLFFHHVPWTYRLYSGKTIIQYVYDSHYKGAEEAAQLGEEWATLKGKIDPQLFEDERAGSSTRPAMPLSGSTPSHLLERDRHSRCAGPRRALSGPAGGRRRAPQRIQNHRRHAVGRRIRRKGCGVRPELRAKDLHCGVDLYGRAGRFDLAVQYFDLQGGVAHFTLGINGAEIVSWAPDDKLPSRRPTATTQPVYCARPGWTRHRVEAGRCAGR